MCVRERDRRGRQILNRGGQLIKYGQKCHAVSPVSKCNTTMPTGHATCPWWTLVSLVPDQLLLPAESLCCDAERPARNWWPLWSSSIFLGGVKGGTGNSSCGWAIAVIDRCERNARDQEEEDPEQEFTNVYLPFWLSLPSKP